jgi:hypothetical protein
VALVLELLGAVGERLADPARRAADRQTSRALASVGA